MSAGAEPESSKSLTPNHVLVAKRRELGWSSRSKAARELQRIGRQRGLPVPDLEAMEKALYRHETGRSAVCDQLYSDLYCAAYGATPHELFGDLTAGSAVVRGALSIRSHKFIPAYVGCEAVERLSATHGAESSIGQWTACKVSKLSVAGGECALYLWPFGIAMFHLVEEPPLRNLAELAVWRQRTYGENLTWASDQLRHMTGDTEVSAAYVLGMYWMNEPTWPCAEMETALRLMCMPRVLLERDSFTSGDPVAHAELVERAILAGGFEHPEILSFGVKGISTGYASWSGVVYYPQAPRRSLSEAELVSCELACQAMWAYCEWISQQVEQGVDPAVPADFGWRFLRGVRSRLINARPQENGQHRSMRQAVLESSGLIGHLTQAAEILRDTHGE